MDATPDTLISELAAHVADALDLVLDDDDVTEQTPRELFIDRLDRDAAAAIASVIRFTGGPGGAFQPHRDCTVQVLTAGPTEAEARARAWAIRELFTDAAGRPSRNADLTTWRMLKIDPIQEPTPIGGNEQGGIDVSFNWLIRAVPIGD